MKFYALLCAAAALILAAGQGCSDRNDNNVPSVTVFTAPAAAIVRAVAGEYVNVYAIVPPGKDAHEYEPTPGDMTSVQRGNAYFSLGTQAEKRLADSVAGAGGIVFRMDKNVPRRLPEDNHGRENISHNNYNSDIYDPHLWMAPHNCIIMAENCAEFLSEIQPQFRKEFLNNKERFVKQMQNIDDELKRRFAPYKGRKFYVFHPAFGYFADACGIQQRAIETGGKNPSPKELENTLAEAAEDHVKTLFACEEFNMDMQNAAAGFLQCKLVILDPLPADPAANFISMADQIIAGFEAEDHAEDQHDY